MLVHFYTSMYIHIHTCLYIVIHQHIYHGVFKYLCICVLGVIYSSTHSYVRPYTNIYRYVYICVWARILRCRCVYNPPTPTYI